VQPAFHQNFKKFSFELFFIVVKSSMTSVIGIKNYLLCFALKELSA
jgi:hypothetical protein